MKSILLLAIAALFLTASVNAQSTVDSIAAKYKLLPMPEPNSLEKTFPVIGSYQLNNTTDATGNLTITLDSTNKGMVWINGLPQGTVKAYLKKSPSTYRILSQKTVSGKQIPEGTLFLDPQTNTLNIALGAPYNEADPTGIFASAMAVAPTMDANEQVKMKAENGDKVKVEGKGNNAVKVKTKSGATNNKSKVIIYTATKMGQEMNMNTTTNAAAADSTKQN